MLYTKRNTAVHLNRAPYFKGVALSLATTLLVSGCNLSDDDDKKVLANVPPTTITVDLVTQTETSITDRLSATDENGDSLSFNLEQQAMLGMVSVDGNGQFTYQPNAEVTGNDSFTFTVTDGINPAVAGMVNITIEALTVSFSSHSRAAFNQQPSDQPLPVNGRVFIQDAETTSAYDDLLVQ